jgi:hypothetical protein
MNWKIALVTLAASAAILPGGAVALSGCGGDDCTRAEDKMNECATSMAASSSGSASMATACSGAYLCHSQCINNFTCTQINGNDPTYQTCQANCQGL